MSRGNSEKRARALIAPDLQDAHLERLVLSTILTYPQAVEAAMYAAGTAWPELWVADATHMAIAASMARCQHSKLLPDVRAVRADLTASGPAGVQAAQALATVLAVPASDASLVEQNVRELFRLCQARYMKVMGDEVQRSLAAGMCPHELVDHVQNGLDRVRGSQIRTMDSRTGVSEVRALVESRRRSGTSMTGIPTGFETLDAALRGLPYGYYVAVGARPGHGKTALACQIAGHVAPLGTPVLIFSLEMDRGQLLTRMACQLCGADCLVASSGQGREDTQAAFDAALEQMSDWPLEIMDDPSVDARMLCSAAVAWRERVGRRGLIVLDYFQLQRLGDGFAGNRNEELTEICATWHHTLRRIECAGLFLAQLNRSSAKEERRPRLSDMRESGILEQDAYGVILPWRPARDDNYRDQCEKAAKKGAAYYPEDYVELNLAKHRNGDLCQARLRFTGASMRFVPRDDAVGQQDLGQEADI